MFDKLHPAPVLAGMDSLVRARDESPQLRWLGEPMTDEALHQRAELIAKVIETRNKLHHLRSKAEELQLALQRFSTCRDSQKR